MEQETIPGWATEAVSVVRSSGGTLALLDYRDNFLSNLACPWPPPEISQKLFASKKISFFPEGSHSALTSKLGYYSDLQSVNSEDALTWNVFGSIGHCNSIERRGFVKRLFQLLDIDDEGPNAHVWTWRRLPHPETLSGNGPELDFGVSFGKTLILGENKWQGGVGQGQGLEQNLDQIQIRSAFLRRSGRLLFPGFTRFVILGVSISGDLLVNKTEVEGDAEFSSMNLNWDSLVNNLDHPGSEDILAYLEWKKIHGRAHRSEMDLITRLDLRVPSKVALVNPPDDFWDTLGNIPQGLDIAPPENELADTVILFARTLSELRDSIQPALGRMRLGGKIWICWPMRSSDLRSDITKDDVIAVGDANGIFRWQPARIDRIWTSFKFQRRR